MKDILVIGGGFFGMYLADHFARMGHNVQLVEKEDLFMSRASFNNQARIHNGYHYPRSILTALRSRVSFPRFVREFGDCVDSEFSKYYLIGRLLGKVSARQFLKFCERIGAPCELVSDKIQKLTNPNLIEACFLVTECAFDAHKLRDLMVTRLQAASVNCHMSTIAEKVSSYENGLLVTLTDIATAKQRDVYADHVFNCTYSNVNYVLLQSCIELVSVRHEMTEMCLVEMPDELKKVGITVMCGPFFSVMPFPPFGLHSFSHVRYTPHRMWQDGPSSDRNLLSAKITDRYASAWRYMQKDAMRYMPILSKCRYERSLWEVKTVLPCSDHDDSRPIFLRTNYGLPGFHCVVGGKIDNVYDAVEAISKQRLFN